MDTNMEDVGRAPADVSPVQHEPATIPTLDGWIESLMTCKQLAEADVQRLCDKVREAHVLPSASCDLDKFFFGTSLAMLVASVWRLRPRCDV